MSRASRSAAEENALNASRPDEALRRRVDALEGHREQWRRKAWRYEEVLAEIHSFAMAREALSYEDHGDEFRRIAQMVRDALPDLSSSESESLGQEKP